MARRLVRGFSFVTVLIIVGLACAVYWALAFGPLYWDNHEITVVMREAGNSAYRGLKDDNIRAFILKSFDEKFGFDSTDERGRTTRKLQLQFEPEDLVIERAQPPAQSIRIAFRYVRTITLPIFGGERSTEFYDDIDTDLTPHKY
jgi:hypothetical protein